MVRYSEMQTFAITGSHLVSSGNHGHVCPRDVCRSILSNIALALKRACWTDEAPEKLRYSDAIRARIKPPQPNLSRRCQPEHTIQNLKVLCYLRNRLFRNHFEGAERQRYQGGPTALTSHGLSRSTSNKMQMA